LREREPRGQGFDQGFPVRFFLHAERMRREAVIVNSDYFLNRS
jgi:hypothetical protein